MIVSVRDGRGKKAVIKPGGRLAVSDIALKQPLPPEIGASLMAYIGCIAGAISLDEYRSGLAAAGFEAVEIVESGSDLNAYAKVENQSGCCSPAMNGRRFAGDLRLLLTDRSARRAGGIAASGTTSTTMRRA